IHGNFWDHLSLSALKTFDVLFCCVDNFEARIRSNTLCYLARTDFVNIGIDSRSVLVELFPFSRTVTVGCLECNLPGSVYMRIAERYSCGQLRKLSFVEKKVPTTIITSTAAGSLAVSLGLRLGSGDGEPEARRIYMDTISGSLTRSALGKSEVCACCGRFDEEPVILKCRADINGLPFEAGTDATVIASEPILASYRIAGQDEEHLVFRCASEFDSTFPASVANDPGAVDLEIRDQFPLGELSKRFAGRAMPCKFAIVSGGNGTFVYEFAEETP
ncbi:MAG: ThiF family adenylyltransferase, partial [Thermomicrobiales bacterium]